VVLLHLVVLLIGQAAWANSERPQAAAPAGRTEPIPPSSLRVTGIVISPQKKVTLIGILDEQGQEVETVWATEGETVKGYRLVAIEVDRVSFEQDGETFVIAISSARAPLPSVVPDLAEADQQGPRAWQGFLELLGQHPEFKPLLDEIRLGEQPGEDPTEAAERHSKLLQKPELQEALRKLWPERASVYFPLR